MTGKRKNSDEFFYGYESPELRSAEAREEQRNMSGSARNRSAAEERKKKRMRKRIIRRRIIAAFLGAAFLTLCFFIVTLFIKVSSITVNGDMGPYSAEQITAAVGINEGDLIFYADTESGGKNAEVTLPYLRNVKVKKSFSRIVITTEICREKYCIQAGSENVLVDENYKALCFVQGDVPTHITYVKGIGCDEPQIGKVLTFTDKDKLKLFETVIEGFKCENIHSISQADMSDKVNMKLTCNDGKLELVLGSSVSIDYKLKFAAGVINRLYETHDDVNGSLDVSILKKAYYSPKAGEAAESYEE